MWKSSIVGRANPALWIALFLCLIGTPIRAALNSASVSLKSATVLVNATSSFTVTWTIERSVLTKTPKRSNVISSFGEFRLPNGDVIGTVKKRLSKFSIVDDFVVGFITFVETVTVPASISGQLAKIEPGFATYRRSFKDGDGSAVMAQIRLVPIFEGTAPLGVRRIELKFDDESRIKTPVKDDRFHAIALLNYNGSGIAKFEWQIAEPPGTSGTVRFKTMEMFSRSLSGGGNLTLESPDLPSRLTGLYFVRLIVRSPVTDFVDRIVRSPVVDFDPPSLRYFVVDGSKADTISEGVVAELVSLPTDKLLMPETVFKWKRVPGAVVYQLEIYRSGTYQTLSPIRPHDIGGGLLVDSTDIREGNLISGIALPAHETSAALLSYSLERLDVSGEYLWRVLAISAGGSIIGRSEARSIWKN